MKTTIGLFSGGLDSLLACKIIINNGFKVIAVNFYTGFTGNLNFKDYPTDYFFTCNENNFELITIDISEDFFKILLKPRFGFGKNINPCIDCKIFFLEQAKKMMENYKAEFVFTGEVLGQRPMSQNINSLKLIEKESGLFGYLLRPLSAKCLKKTEPEKNNIIIRENLYNIQGRSRKRQLELAEQLEIKNYSTPAGGCLLTEQKFSERFRDLQQNVQATFKQTRLLKAGRHFRFQQYKIIVGRHENDNKKISELADEKDILLKVVDIPGPTTIIPDYNKNSFDNSLIKQAAILTLRYSDAKPNTKYTVNIYDKNDNILKPINIISPEDIKDFDIQANLL